MANVSATRASSTRHRSHATARATGHVRIVGRRTGGLAQGQRVPLSEERLTGLCLFTQSLSQVLEFLLLRLIWLPKADHLNTNHRGRTFRGTLICKIIG